jgi:hypothetical protein
LDSLSRAIRHGLEWRDDPKRRPNAIEGHGEAIKEAAEKIERGFESISSAIGDSASAIRDKQKPTS